MKLNIRFLIGFIILFTLEFYIALFVHDKIIRPYLGDVLVVILMYAFIRIFTDKLYHLPMYLFLFSVFIEILQYFNFISLIGLEKNSVISIIIGHSFDIVDIGCYFCGSIILIIYEKTKHAIRK